MAGWSFSLSCVLTRPKQDLLLLSWEGAPGWGKEAPESCSMGAEPAWTSDGGMEEETGGVGEERMKRRRGGKAWVTTKSKWLTTCGSKWKWRGGGTKGKADKCNTRSSYSEYLWPPGGDNMKTENPLLLWLPIDAQITTSGFSFEFCLSFFITVFRTTYIRH